MSYSSFWALPLSGSSINPSLASSLGSGKNGIILKFPLKLDQGWYDNIPCTKFQSFQHRKYRTGFEHEFIVLKLVDRSVCRVERMGDPKARLNGLGFNGSQAYDIIQYYPSEDDPGASLHDSDVVAEITLPYERDIIEVLMICRAIHEGEKTCNYNLLTYNCYFFALAIQSVLARRIKSWSEDLSNRSWDSQMEGSINNAISQLSTAYTTSPLNPAEYSFIQCLYMSTGPNIVWPSKDLVTRLKDRFLKQEFYSKVRSILESSLWDTDVKVAVSYLVEKTARDAMTDVLRGTDAYPLQDTLSLDRYPSAKIITNQTQTLLGMLVFQAALEHRNLEPQYQTLFNRIKKYIKYFQRFAKTRTPQMQLVPSKSAQKVKDLDYHRVKEPGSSPNPNLIGFIPKFQWIFSRAQLSFTPILVWPAQVVLGIYSLVLSVSSTRLRGRATVEQELASYLSSLNSLDYPLGSKGTASLLQKLDCLVNHSNGVQWEEWPWTHISVAIQTAVFNMIDGQTRASLHLNTSSVSLDLQVRAFQDHVRTRIKQHANRVGSLLLGSANQIQNDIEDKLAEVWSLYRDRAGVEEMDAAMVDTARIAHERALKEAGKLAKGEIYEESKEPLPNEGGIRKGSETESEEPRQQKLASSQSRFDSMQRGIDEEPPLSYLSIRGRPRSVEEPSTTGLIAEGGLVPIVLDHSSLAQPPRQAISHNYLPPSPEMSNGDGLPTQQYNDDLDHRPFRPGPIW